MKFFKNSTVSLLLIILVGGFIVRLYGFTNPVADWHSWRQVDTSAVSRNFVNNGFDILHPRYDDISNVQTTFDNPEGYRFVEFPIYNVAQAGLFKIFGVLTLEQWGRLVTIFSSVLTGLFLYLLISRRSNKAIGLLSAFFYMFIPYNIYYGRVILPDTTMAMAILGGIYFFDRWVTEKSKNTGWFFVLALLFTSAAFLLKPYATFFVLPMAVIAYQRWGWKLLLQWKLWLFAIVSLGFLGAWRLWISQYPEGIPSNMWLLNSNGIRFRPAFFRWILFERLTRLISGYVGIIIPLIGILKVWKLKEWPFFISFVISSVLYVVIFATGNVQHDYYQILIMPTVSIFFAIGSYHLYRWTFKKFPLGKVILLLCLAGMFWFGWMIVREYFNINNRSIIAAGEAVDRLTPKNAKVIANLNGDTTLLYHTKRKGWPSFQADLPDMINKLGAEYLVLLNPTEQDLKWKKEYTVVALTSQYVIFDLRQKP